MKKITLTLTDKFRQWVKEHPDQALTAIPIGPGYTTAARMDDECYKALVARAEKLGCTVINLLIGSDDFASHIEIEDLDDPTVKGFEPIESVNMILPPKNVPQG